MDLYLEKIRKIRTHTVKTTVILQDVDKIKDMYPNTPMRSYNHKFKSNNWLKLHREPMRRKPFKRSWDMLDEIHVVYALKRC